MPVSKEQERRIRLALAREEAGKLVLAMAKGSWSTNFGPHAQDIVRIADALRMNAEPERAET